MANSVKKLQINIDVQAAFNSALKEADKFKKELNNLSLPKSITKDLEKDLNNYQKAIQKALNFKPTTNNLNEYKTIINSINDNFITLSSTIAGLEKNTSEAFGSNKEIDNYTNKIKNLKEEIAELDKQTKAYYGVTSADSKIKRDAAVNQKKIDILTGGKDNQTKLSGAALESVQKKQEKLNNALNRGVTARKELESAEKKLQEAIEKNNIAQQKASQEAAKVKNNFNNLTPVINSAKESYEQFSREAANFAIQERAQDLTSTVKRWTAFGVAVNYARNQLSNMKQTYLELDASLTQIAVVSGKTRQEMWDNIESFNEMARRLGTTTAEVVEASKLYYQQGKTQTEVMELVEQTAILASISELEFADATEYLTAAINGFKLEATDATNVTDVWANLAAKAAVDTDELAVAISKVASIAKSAGADIETTSAFLTKMIETTREAPENLGTALKTIIARFQELSDSTEALEDGVDANKVEKALKEADVALRDSTGQFRDFDDVIMELSSKWDGLDRNTQRYIATIAAGSRQQSRFIALVEDYDRNIELVNMAQTSAGASAAQFNTQLTGLQASINRLQSAWEGLYTSINASEGFSLLVDSAATLVSNLADLGLGFTSISAIILFTFSKIAISSAANTTTFLANETSKQLAIATTTSALKLQAIAAKGSLAAMAPQLATIGVLVAAVAAFAAAIYGLNRVFNKNKIAAREATEAIQKYTGEMGAANQEISSLEALQKEYEEAYLKGKDLTEIKQQLIDQYPDITKELNIEKASYQELTKAIEDYIVTKKAESAEAAFGAINARETKQVSETKDELLDLEEKLDLLSGARAEAEMNPLAEFTWGEEIISAEELLEKYAELERRADELRAKLEEPAKANAGEIQSIAADFIIDEGLKGDYAQQYISSLLSDLTSADIEEEGLKEGTIPFAKNVMQSYIDAIDQVMSSNNYEITNALSRALSGDTSAITRDIIEQWKNMGFDIAAALPDVYAAYEEEMKNYRAQLAPIVGAVFDPNIQDYPSLVKIPDEIVRSWAKKLEEVEDDSRLTSLYESIFEGLYDSDFLKTLDEDQKQIIESATSDVESLMNVYTALGNSSEGVGAEIKKNIVQVLSETGEIATFVEDQLNSLSTNLNKLKDASSEGLSFEDFNNMQVEYGLTSEDIKSYDALTGKIYLTEDAILNLAEAKKVEAITSLNAAIAAEQENSALITQRNQSLQTALTTLQLASSANSGAGAEVNLASAINQVNKQLGIEAPAVDAASTSYEELQKKAEELAIEIQNQLQKGADDYELSQERIKIYETLRDSTMNLSVAENVLAGSTGGSSSATNSATDAAKAYADALKEQAEALKEAAEAEQERIETEVEGIKKVLEARKEALEEQNELLQEQIDKEKEAQEIILEAYLKYLEKRQNEYQDSLDEMEKAAEEARELADKNNEELNFTNEIAQDYYKDQIALIDEKINALNEEAEAEDRLQKLQEARDAYERAKNTKNRLVLVRGAGWVFKRDQEEISSTYDALQDAEREVEIAKLENEKELLQEQADAWAEKAENIGKSTEELEKYNKAYEDFANLTEEQRKEALNAYIEAILKNNELNQDATDKENAFEDQSDADKEGTLAWNIAKVEELSEQTSELIDQIGKSAEELIKDNRINEVVASLDSLLGEQGIEGLTNHLDTLTHGVNSYIDNFLKLSEQMTQNENAIEAIDQALDDWDELTENLGKSQSELNKELEIFNRYNQLTIEQLSKNSAVYNDIANQVSNLADQWERVNAAEAAYEAAQARADSLSSGGEGYATGGVNTYTGLAAVHGTKSRPEVFLNNSQAGALFKFIEGLTKMPTLSKKRNIPQVIEKGTSSLEDNSTNYTNCKFEVVSNENSIEKLLQDVKNRSPLRKF